MKALLFLTLLPTFTLAQSMDVRIDKARRLSPLIDAAYLKLGQFRPGTWQYNLALEDVKYRMTQLQDIAKVGPVLTKKDWDEFIKKWNEYRYPATAEVNAKKPLPLWLTWNQKGDTTPPLFDLKKSNPLFHEKSKTP